MNLGRLEEARAQPADQPLENEPVAVRGVRCWQTMRWKRAAQEL